MKRRIQIFVTMVTVLCLGASQVHAAIDWDFYDDGTIQEGDEYANVRVFDTPPDHTTVDMLGGIVDSISAHDESTVNLSGGSVNTLSAFNSSTINAFGGFAYTLWAYDMGTANVSDSADVFSLVAREYGVVNMSGGVVDHLGPIEFGTVNLSGGFVSDSLASDSSGVINVFGYNLNKVPTGGKYGFGFVAGQWEDSTAFSIDLMESPTFSRVTLHEIPEPTMFAIIITGVLFLRKRRR
jgi:hypothetical protein